MGNGNNNNKGNTRFESRPDPPDIRRSATHRRRDDDQGGGFILRHLRDGSLDLDSNAIDLFPNAGPHPHYDPHPNEVSDGPGLGGLGTTSSFGCSHGNRTFSKSRHSSYYGGHASRYTRS